MLLVSSAPESFLVLNAVEMKIRRLVLRSRIGGSGAASVPFSFWGEVANVAGRSLLSRIGSLASSPPLEVDENELVSEDVDDEMVGRRLLSSDWLNVEKVGAERS